MTTPFKPELSQLITSFPSDCYASQTSSDRSLFYGLSSSPAMTDTPHSSMAVEYSNSETRRRNSSIVSLPSSPLETTITRSLPVRPRYVAEEEFIDDESTNRGQDAAIFHSEIDSSKEPRGHCVQSHTTPISSSPTHVFSPQPCFAVHSRRSRRKILPPPPRYHVIVRRRRTYHNSLYTHVLNHLATPLVPLISVTTGLPHPEFPHSLLQYHLLTHKQLDRLARHYHQVLPPVRETWQYPCAVPGWVGIDEEGDDGATGADHDEDYGSKRRRVSLRTKRRRWGRFMGLRGCETPTAASAKTSGRNDHDGEDDIEERMEREWQRALERQREEERASDKIWRRW